MGVAGVIRQQHGSRLPEQLVTLIDHETKAAAISEFEAFFVPGLLQTGEYARAVISRNVNVPPDGVERWLIGERFAIRDDRRSGRDWRKQRAQPGLQRLVERMVGGGLAERDQDAFGQCGTGGGQIL